MRDRGIDFVHRFNTGRWAEDLLIAALGAKHDLIAVRFGISEVRHDGLQDYVRGEFKEPDLLIYDVARLAVEEQAVLRERDLVKEPRSSFIRGGALHFVMRKALAAIEVEFSPYKAAEMKDRHWKPRSREAWEKR